ncbi:HNH endonuclease [Klebsiella pneumoniae subsp. pneumoniae]|jgi:hypothetical protein|nr:HNH endonuclease signature motif containing protein [Klebsiella pneumoniae]ESN44941.1 hypothetical protein L366_01024 [Klebsiella variicola]EWD40726.1 hypothetical protein P837_02534 [Klebsiella pneumoniae UCI 34]OYM70736.1 HNH endonuclease [Klebsiella pneumoniae subsp. pneumoniae]ASC26533.1 hypothetical protein AM399_00860 [Klebsiella pneumoniae]ASC41241.1 hypothetical protein AM392_20070 [Klebsiella pneumoniae]
MARLDRPVESREHRLCCRAPLSVKPTVRFNVKDHKDIPVDWVSSCIDYNADSGVLTWKRRPSSHFKNRQAHSAWNSRFQGKTVGWKSSAGYLSLAIDEVKFQAHRVAWAIYHQSSPSGVIDHINGNKTDNRITNLRVVEFCENMKNVKRYSNNTSGIAGVRWYSQRSKWVAYINVDGKRKQLGYYALLDDAIDARKKAEVENGYHENHGRE